MSNENAFLKKLLSASKQYIFSRHNIYKILLDLYNTDKKLYKEILNSEKMLEYKKFSEPFTKLIDYYDNFICKAPEPQKNPATVKNKKEFWGGSGYYVTENEYIDYYDHISRSEGIMDASPFNTDEESFDIGLSTYDEEDAYYS